MESVVSQFAILRLYRLLRVNLILLVESDVVSVFIFPVDWTVVLICILHFGEPDVRPPNANA